MNNLSEMNEQMNVIKGPFERSLMTKLADKIRAWNARRLAISELHAMPDSLLKDLGIERYQIMDVVNQTGQFAELRPSKPDSADAAPLQQAAA